MRERERERARASERESEKQRKRKEREGGGESTASDLVYLRDARRGRAGDAAISPAPHTPHLQVHYVGTLPEDGSEFDSSRKRNVPFEFTLGMAEVVPGFEKAVMGMEVGEKKSSTFPPAEGYGEPRENMMVTLQPGTLPPGAKLDLGTEVQLPTGQIARVVDVGEDGSFKIDANHKLAGKSLTFEIELLKCIEPKLVSDSGFSLEKIPLEQQILEAKAADLSKMSMNVIFNHGTEPPFTGKTVDGTPHDCKEPGQFVCGRRVCACRQAAARQRFVQPTCVPVLCKISPCVVGFCAAEQVHGCVRWVGCRSSRLSTSLRVARAGQASFSPSIPTTSWSAWTRPAAWYASRSCVRVRVRIWGTSFPMARRRQASATASMPLPSSLSQRARRTREHEH